MAKEYTHVPATFPALWACRGCGAVVYYKDVHNEVDCG